MPEHTPETFDLDRAFDTLTTDVRAGTASRGADPAIGAPRRRRTTIGAAAAVALIAIGGVVFSQLGGSDRLSPSEEIHDGRVVPAPAPLDAAAMSSVTAGWVSDWHDASEADQPVLEAMDGEFGCSSDRSTGDTTDPTRAGSNLLIGDQGQVGLAAFADFGDDSSAAAASVDELASAFAACASGDPVTVTYGSGGSVVHYAVTANGSRYEQEAWVARLGNTFALVMVLAPGDPSDEVSIALGDAMMAALQDDASYRISDGSGLDSGSGSASSSPSSSSGSSAPTPAHRSIGEEELADALGGWSTWTANGNMTAMQLPCLGDNGMTDSTSSSGTSIGTTGEQSFSNFDSAADAAKAVPELTAGVLACDSAQWNLDSTTVPGVVVASSDHGAAWIAQQGATVTVFKLGDSGTPPKDVAVAVGKLVLETLAP